MRRKRKMRKIRRRRMMRSRMRRLKSSRLKDEDEDLKRLMGIMGMIRM